MSSAPRKSPTRAPQDRTGHSTFAVTDGTTTVTGQFASGGTVTLIDQSVIGTACTQTYAVQGGLLPSGRFSGTLVHYGYWTGTSCNVFFAMVTGTAHLRE